ncbi:MAG: trehalose-phosphatase [Acidimicrobiales bacterium]
MTDARAVAAPFVEAPQRSVLLFDFDGTLAPIVADPDDARPAPGVADRLAALAERYALVGAISGRPVSFLAAHLPAEIALSGLYGLEARINGTRATDPQAERWRPVVADAVRRLAADGPDAMRLEDKGLSLTVHYREHPEAAPAVDELADEVAAATGLVARLAKMSVELHPPVEADKGTALRALVDQAVDAVAVLYAGDDLGDLPAFDALDDLGRAGMHVARIAVCGAEAPTELAARADWVADSPAALGPLLDAFLLG